PFGASASTALFNAYGVVRVRAPLIKETSLMAGFLLSEIRTLHRTPFDYSPQAAHPFGASASTALFNAYGVVRVRAPLIKETSLMAGFLLSEIRTLHRTSFDYSPQAAHPFGASA
ncbi:hypothetical protein, partial [Lonsdalea quercina]|uniref:hypothetical protein n=1 Tax=Lonsdalea quercina TaxID=71657 RepID=UPI0039749335